MTPTTETWLPVVGYEGLYEVSDLGRVRSLDRVIVRSNGHPQTCHGRVLFLGTGPDGRHVVSLYNDGRRGNCRPSVLVLEAFVGPRPTGMVCCHNNGLNTDDRASNLRWDTPSANELDKRIHGTQYLVNRTHCPRRHPLVAPNLIPSLLLRGTRTCLACNRAKSRGRDAIKRGDAFDLKSESDRFFKRIMQEAHNDRADTRGDDRCRA